MSNETPEWLRDLMDEYSHSTERKSDRSLQRMLTAFRFIDPAVMKRAIDAFILNDPRPIQQQAYFPAIAHLQPFVAAALDDNDALIARDMSLAQRRQKHEQNMAAIRSRIKHGDDELFEFETARGWRLSVDENGEPVE